MNILLIEDDAGLVELITQMLKELGFSVMIATSGAEVLAHLEKQTPDLMLLDYSLPDINGKELIETLIKQQTPLPPFIITTGQGDERIAVDMMKLGAKDYLIKDILFLEKLPAVVQRVIKEIESEDKLKQVEEAYMETARQLKTLVNNLQGIAYRCKNDANWTMEYVSEGFENITGYPTDDVINNKNFAFNSLIVPEQRDEVWDEVQKAVASKEQYKLNYKMVRADGRIVQILEKGEGVYAESNGKLIALEGFITDVTELKEAEEKVKAAEKKSRINAKYYENIINNMGDPVFVKDDQSRLLLANDAFCNIFDLPRDKIIGKTLAEDVPPNEREQFLKIDKQVILDGKDNVNEETLTVRDGKTRTISTRKTQFTDNNGKKFLVGVIRDITERKLAEEELIKHREHLEELVL